MNAKEKYELLLNDAIRNGKEDARGYLTALGEVLLPELNQAEEIKTALVDVVKAGHQPSVTHLANTIERAEKLLRGGKER
jgi:hypothetical protein